MNSIFQQELVTLKDDTHVDKNVTPRFIDRLKQGKYTRDENPSDHFCSFFLPIDLQNKSIYLVDHIKAGSWIPPGGHIDLHESPVATVVREFKEELGWTLTDEKISLFDLTISYIKSPPGRLCKVHYDFWYAVFIDQKNFAYEKREFNAVGWFSVKEALQRMKVKQYKKIITKVPKLFEL